MKPVMQTIIGSGDDGQPMGTCQKACIASLLEIEEHQVLATEHLSDSEWFPPLYDWLIEQGYEYHGIRSNEEDLLNPKFNKGIGGYLLVSGGSPRGFRRGHAVIYKNGKLVHDPHPSGDGITEFKNFWILEKIATKS